MSLTATWGSQMRWSPREDHRNQEESQRKRTDPQPPVMVNVFCDLGARRKAANEGGTQKHKHRRHGFHPFLHSYSVFNCLQVYDRSSPRQSPLRLVASQLFAAATTRPPFRGPRLQATKAMSSGELVDYLRSNFHGGSGDPWTPAGAFDG